MLSIFFVSGFTNFFKNLWTACTGPDTPSFFTKKEWTNDPANIPAAAIAVQRESTWLGGGIRKVTGEWGNHIIGCMGGLDTIEAMPNGIQPGSIKTNMRPTCQMIIFVKKDLTLDQCHSILGFLQGAVGKAYAYFKLVYDFLIGGDDSSNTTEFCSEVETRAYKNEGIKISNSTPQQTSPGEVQIYLLSKEGIASGWYIYDTYNITLEDALKTGYDYIVS